MANNKTKKTDSKKKKKEEKNNPVEIDAEMMNELMEGDGGSGTPGGREGIRTIKIKEGSKKTKVAKEGKTKK